MQIELNGLSASLFEVHNSNSNNPPVFSLKLQFRDAQGNYHEVASTGLWIKTRRDGSQVVDPSTNRPIYGGTLRVSQDQPQQANYQQGGQSQQNPPQGGYQQPRQPQQNQAPQQNQQPQDGPPAGTYPWDQNDGAPF